MNIPQQQLPFQNNELLRSEDLCEARTLVNNLVDQREFTPLTKSNPGTIAFNAQQLGDTKLIAGTWRQKISARSVSLANYCLIVPLSGFIYSVRSKQTITVGTALLFPPGSHTDVIWQVDTCAVVIHINAHSVCNYFSVHGQLAHHPDEIILTRDTQAGAWSVNRCDWCLR